MRLWTINWQERGHEMRLELRDKPEEKRELVAKVWLERDRGGAITLFYQIEDGPPHSMAYFNGQSKEFYVFDKDVEALGFKLTSTNHPFPED